VHPAIANLARKALTTPPEKRFSSAAEMRDSIEAAMLDARVATTTADVAAFVVEHLAERTAKRRQTIDIALAAAAERERVEEILKPAIERTDSGMTSAPGRTHADAPAALRGATSGVTPPGVSTGVDSSPLPELPASNPRRTVLVAGFAGGAIALAAVGVLALLRPPAAQTAAPSLASSTAAPAEVPVALSAAASAVASASSGAAPSESGIPVFAADSLPKAGASPQTTAAPPAPARAGPAVRPPPKRKKTVDDGF
jgi:hypothetical protein